MPSKNKVAIVHDFLVQLGGAERVLQAIHEIYPDSDVYTLAYDRAATSGKFDDWKIIAGRNSNRGYRTRVFSYPKTIESFNLKSYDLVISSNSAFAKGVITPKNIPHICYCHAPMRYVWDWYLEYLKENQLDRGIKTLLVRLLLHRLRLWDKTSADRVDYWIANSINIKNRIAKYYHREAKVVYPPVETTCQAQPKKDYFICYGRLIPYKKIDLAIAACRKLNKKLIIIGAGNALDNLKKQAAQTPGLIQFFGPLPDKELKKYLAQAKALIFPGEDDFGITPVEANACATPVIAFRKGGVLESQIENMTAIFFSEPSAESLAEAIKRFEKFKFDPDNLTQQAKKFSRERFKREFKKYVDDCIGKSKVNR